MILMCRIIDFTVYMWADNISENIKLRSFVRSADKNVTSVSIV